MFCTKCGQKNADENVFCISCGTPLNPQVNPQVNPIRNEFDASVFAHPSDIKALNALKSIPGFSQLLKGFFKFYNERQLYIENMSSNLKLSEHQLPQIYNMLPPICEKMGIKTPDLFLEMNVFPNAYTSGDNDPFIVVTSGLLDTMPKELIPTVLAHEVGHIVCHHTLYHTMGQMILNGTLATMDSFGLSKLVSLPLKVAFYYWMRCSEYSADRVAVLYDETSENLIEMCMRFSGYKDDNHRIEAKNKELFIQQAIDYRNYVQDSNWNKTLEFLILKDRSHPLNAVRAYEANLWTGTQQYADAVRLINSKQ